MSAHHPVLKLGYSLSQYSRVCGSYQLLIPTNLLNQVFLMVSLKSRLRKFFGRHHDLANRYEISVSQMTADMSGPSFLFHDIIQFLTRATRLVPLVGQEIITLPQQLSSPSSF
jgi:hypothetical protein